MHDFPRLAPRVRAHLATLVFEVCSNKLLAPAAEAAPPSRAIRDSVQSSANVNRPRYHPHHRRLHLHRNNRARNGGCTMRMNN